MKTSIVAGAYARQLVEALDAERAALRTGERDIPWAVRVTSNSRHPVTIGARLCWQRYKGKVELTGGVLLWAEAPPPSYTSRRWETQKRLKPGFSNPQLYRHACDVFEIVRRWSRDPIVLRREALDLYSQTKAFDIDKLPRESSVFDVMLDDEIDFWFGWLAQQPDKAPATISEVTP